MPFGFNPPKSCNHLNLNKVKFHAKATIKGWIKGWTPILYILLNYHVKIDIKEQKAKSLCTPFRLRNTPRTTFPVLNISPTISLLS